MKKNIIILILFSIVMTILSLIIVRIDLFYYSDLENKWYDLQDEFFIFSTNKPIMRNCDWTCVQYRGFPLPIKAYPVLHNDMIWNKKNIFFNIFFYLLIWNLFLFTTFIYNKSIKILKK